MKNKGVPIVREGWPFVALAASSCVIFLVAHWWGAFLIALIATAFVTYFFRNPERLAPVGPYTVASPADGKVIFIGPVLEPDIFHDERIKISIFMSVFDVHVNRAPIDGTVVKKIRHHGQFLAAFDDRASDENERTVMHIQSKNGFSVVLVQIAGLIARRILCYPEEGTFIMKGQRIGLIRFGSRCDLFVPSTSLIHVKLGDKVVGGETTLAEFKSSEL